MLELRSEDSGPGSAPRALWLVGHHPHLAEPSLLPSARTEGDQIGF